jgi:CheY-like chemotaxis protein
MDTLSILVVADNQAHAVGLVELLEIQGFSSFRASSGGEALQTAAIQSFDAVLLDVDLPDISGWEVCRRLRQDDRTANLAIVFHSGSELPYKLGHQGDAFLTYPIESSDLFGVILGCVARRRRAWS